MAPIGCAGHAGAPEHGAGGDRLAAQFDASGIDPGDATPGADLDPEPFERVPGCPLQASPDTLEQGVAAFDEDDPGVGRIDVAEVLPQRLPRNLGQRAGQLDPGRAATDDRQR